jgi:hypothetical protein
MHVYSTQHTVLTPFSEMGVFLEPPMLQSPIRADSSQRGSKMPQDYWDTRPSAGESHSYSSDLGLQASPVPPGDIEPLIAEPEIQLPAQGTPGESIQSESDSSAKSSDASKSSDYRSEQNYYQLPDQGAPATTPETGQDSDLKATKVEPNSKVGFDGYTGVQTKDSVDTTVRPELTDDPNLVSSTDDVVLSERIRTGLITGNEGRPNGFTVDSLQGVKITSQNGVVTLDGQVGNQQEKQDLESRVREMPGVISVVNMLEVSPVPNSLLPEPK